MTIASALGGCSGREHEPTAYVPDASTASPAIAGARVVLVTIDGARWQDVFEGSDPTWGPRPPLTPEAIMPRAHALARTRGAAFGGGGGGGAIDDGCGGVHTASGANRSLPGYREIFTAHPSRCIDNGCGRVSWTILDEAAHRGVARVASIGSWNGLASAVSGGSDVLVSVGHGWPGEPEGPLADLVAAGKAADAYPGHDDYRPDSYTAAIALEYLRDAKPALLHIGLGDTDEYGHRGDYFGYLAALRAADTLIGELADRLDLATTTILVTPDHGRNANFRDHDVLGVESGRTFLFAFGDQVVARGLVCPSRDVTLADVAPTIAVLLGLPLDTSPGAGRPIREIVTRLL